MTKQVHLIGQKYQQWSPSGDSQYISTGELGPWEDHELGPYW
jgi:hypothetical protein